MGAGGSVPLRPPRSSCPAPVSLISAWWAIWQQSSGEFLFLFGPHGSPHSALGHVLALYVSCLPTHMLAGTFFPALPQSTESAPLLIQLFLKPCLSISFYIFFSHINPPEHRLGICKQLLYVKKCSRLLRHSGTK